MLLSSRRAESEGLTKKWLGMEGSNLRFLIQSQASYHWTNPQHYARQPPVSRPPPILVAKRPNVKFLAPALPGHSPIKTVIPPAQQSFPRK